MASYVLVVESDPDLQQRIAQALREANYDLSTERESKWARRSLLIRPPDGVVVNTALADGTGFQVAEELRKDPDTKDVPVFFVAGRYRGASHAAEARRRFAPAHYLPAPLDLNTLLAHMLASVPPQARPRSPMLTPEPPAPSVTDVDQVREARGVEREAKKIAGGKVESGQSPADSSEAMHAAAAIMGTLERQSFASVLRRLYVERRSGALLVVQGTRKKIVLVSDGYPVSVRSNVVSECLGQILVSHKRISPAVLDESVRRMKAEKRQQGEILIEMGALSPHGLVSALVEQTEAKLFDLFSWTAGSWSFKDGVQESADPIKLERPTAALIFDGVRRAYSVERQEQALNSMAGKFVVPTDDVRLRMQDMTVDPHERAFIDGIDGSQMLEMILNVPPIPKDKARWLLVAMIEAGMVEGSDGPVERAVRPDSDESGTAASDAGGRMGKSELSAILEKTRAQTHFEVLGVGPEADPREVESAYVRKARTFHPDGYRANVAEVRDLVDQIFSRVGEARSVLRDPTKRKSYVKRLERARSFPGGGEAAAAAAEQVYFTGVEHLRARRYAEAVKALESATHLVPGQASYHGSLGWALYRRAPTDAEAVRAGRQHLERSVALEEEDPWPRVSLGRFLSETGDADGAVKVFEEALALQPDLPEIENEIRRLRGNAR